MTNESRNEILTRIRAATGSAQRSDVTRKALEERNKARPIGPRPVLPDDLLEHFIVKAHSNLFKVERIGSLQMFVPLIRDLLTETAAADVSIAPALSHLEWPQNWTINIGPARKTERVSVTLAIAGIAETGSVVLRSDSNNPTSLNFLPDVHVVLLRVADIVAYAEDVWARMRSGSEDWPRTVNMIAGPSRTADVGGIIVRPAHGPKEVRLVLLDA